MILVGSIGFPSVQGPEGLMAKTYIILRGSQLQYKGFRELSAEGSDCTLIICADITRQGLDVSKNHCMSCAVWPGSIILGGSPRLYTPVSGLQIKCIVTMFCSIPF